jgi:anti-anti-sigma regulatory factor
VVVLEVLGQLHDGARDLDHAIQTALADGPRGVVCDLSGVFEDVGSAAMDVLAAAGRHVRDWPVVPVAVVSADPQVRNTLTADPLGKHLIVASALLPAVSTVLAGADPVAEWLELAPHPTAPRASRDFVTRTLLDWGLGRVIPSASLVVSELVTNSTMYAGTDINLSVVWNQGALRLTVRDDSPRLPLLRHSTLDLHGRGLTIVAGLSRAFGVLPTSDGGKVVWAVLDAPQPRSSSSPVRSSVVTGETPMRSGAAMVPSQIRRQVVLAPLDGPQVLADPGAAARSPRPPKPRRIGLPTLTRARKARRAYLRPYNDPSNFLG